MNAWRTSSSYKQGQSAHVGESRILKSIVTVTYSARVAAPHTPNLSCPSRAGKPGCWTVARYIFKFPNQVTKPPPCSWHSFPSSPSSEALSLLYLPMPLGSGRDGEICLPLPLPQLLLPCSIHGFREDLYRQPCLAKPNSPHSPAGESLEQPPALGHLGTVEVAAVVGGRLAVGSGACATENWGEEGTAKSWGEFLLALGT